MANQKAQEFKTGSYIAKALGDYLEQSRDLRTSLTPIQQKQPKPSDILKEYKASEELKKIAEASEEMQRYQIPGTVGDYLKEKEDMRTRSQEILDKAEKTKADQAKEARKAEETRTESILKLKSEQEAKERETLIKSQKEEVLEQEIQSRIEAGEGFLPSIIQGKYPKSDLVIRGKQDIPIVMDAQDAPDRTQVEAFFTLDDISYMLKNEEFQKAGITNERVKEILKIGDDGKTTSESRAEDVQELLFQYFKTPQGAGFKNALKIRIAEPSITIRGEGVGLDDLSAYNKAVMESINR